MATAMMRRKVELARAPQALIQLPTLLLALASVPAQAQEAAGAAPGLSVRPRIGITQTWTSNLTLRSTNEDAALITNISPGVSVVSNSGRIRGSFDYTLDGLIYVKTAQSSRVQQSLSAQGAAELVPGQIYLDVRASIGQQTASAFGPQTIDSRLDNPNRREVATLNLSPYARGQIAGLFTYDLRANVSETNVRDSVIGDSRGTGVSLRLDDARRGALRWYASADVQQTKFRAGNESRTDSARLGFNYRPDVDWQVGLNAGGERNNFVGNAQRSGFSYGANGEWTPSPRTRLAADWQSQSFGNTYSVTFEHRLARSVVRATDSRSVNLGNSNGTGGFRTNYDLFYLQLASAVPDPAQRDLAVRALLQAAGLSPDAPATGGFLASGPTQFHRQDLSFSHQGLRTTATVQIGRTVSTGLSASLGDLASTGRIEQRTASLNASYRLTPQSSISLTVSEQQTRGGSAAQSTSLHSVLANWTARLGRSTNFSLGTRFSVFESVTPYRENAVFANLVQQL